jgi:hypothetical protein
MKIFKSFMLLVAVICLLSAANVKPKTYTIKLTETQIITLYNTLGFAKTAMITSRQPSVEVHDASVTIDSLQSVIKQQYLQQKDTTKTK